VSRISTPFDLFIQDVSIWLGETWFFFVIAALAIAAVAVVVVSKLRARDRAQQLPQYRRTESL